LINKLRYKWNCWRRDISWHLGHNRSYLTGAKGARILLYHGICREDPLRFNTLFVDIKTFEAHLKFYKKYYNVISLDDFYQQRFTKDRFNICLTFDDGFANNHKYVLPLLEQYQMPATFFVTGIRDAGYDILWNDFLSIITKYGPGQLDYKGDQYIKNRGRYVSAANGKALVDTLRSSDFIAKKEMMQQLSSLSGFKKQPYDEEYWQQMTEAQIRNMAASPHVTIGDHGYYHNDLSGIPVNQAVEEMVRSKKYLEIIIGKEIKALAFPYGAYSAEVREEAKKIGFSQLLATRFILPDDASDATMRERLTINPFISVINQMHANTTGRYG
jgi:peptidoglycan/xylan/chitin deacetylase (PgdA/CDA1 family)